MFNGTPLGIRRVLGFRYAALNHRYVTERKTWRRWSDDDDVAVRLGFPIPPSVSSNVAIDSAELKLLVPPQANRHTIRIQLFQILGARRRRFVRERDLFVSQTLNKWCEFDVTDVVRNWVSGDRNLGIELQCSDCKGSLQVLQASISALIRVSCDRNVSAFRE